MDLDLLEKLILDMFKKFLNVKWHTAKSVCNIHVSVDVIEYIVLMLHSIKKRIFVYYRVTDTISRSRIWSPSCSESSRDESFNDALRSIESLNDE